MRIRWLLLLAVALALVASCAAGDPRFTADQPAGFWMGLWHGLIAWVALIIGLFNDHVQIYERVNTGGWYDFGFLIGATCLFGAGHQSQRRWRCRKSKQEIPPSGHLTVDVKWKSDADDAVIDADAAGDDATD